MNRRKGLILLGVVGLIMALSVPMEVVSQTLTLEWSDDFTDGNYNGWNVTAGAYAVTGGKLTVTDIAPGHAFPVILHPSNSTFGNWSCDVVIGDDPEELEHVLVCIMRDIGGTGAWNGIMLEYLGYQWHLIRDLNPAYESFPTDPSWEHHLRLERARADPNHMKVYHNGTLALNTLVLVPYLDNASYYFGFSGTRGASIDNINVEYEPYVPEVTSTDTTSDTTTDDTTTDDSTTNGGGNTGGGDSTMLLLLAGGGAAAVIVIVLVVKMRS